MTVNSSLMTKHMSDSRRISLPVQADILHSKVKFFVKHFGGKDFLEKNKVLKKFLVSEFFSGF